MGQNCCGGDSTSAQGGAKRDTTQGFSLEAAFLFAENQISQDSNSVRKLVNEMGWGKGSGEFEGAQARATLQKFLVNVKNAYLLLDPRPSQGKLSLRALKGMLVRAECTPPSGSLSNRRVMELLNTEDPNLFAKYALLVSSAGDQTVRNSTFAPMNGEDFLYYTVWDFINAQWARSNSTVRVFPWTEQERRLAEQQLYVSREQRRLAAERTNTLQSQPQATQRPPQISTSPKPRRTATLSGNLSPGHTGQTSPVLRPTGPRRTRSRSSFSAIAHSGDFNLNAAINFLMNQLPHMRNPQQLMSKLHSEWVVMDGDKSGFVTADLLPDRVNALYQAENPSARKLQVHELEGLVAQWMEKTKMGQKAYLSFWDFARALVNDAGENGSRIRNPTSMDRHISVKPSLNDIVVINRRAGLVPGADIYEYALNTGSFGTGTTPQASQGRTMDFAPKTIGAASAGQSSSPPPREAKASPGWGASLQQAAQQARSPSTQTGGSVTASPAGSTQVFRSTGGSSSPAGKYTVTQNADGTVSVSGLPAGSQVVGGSHINATAPVVRSTVSPVQRTVRTTTTSRSPPVRSAVTTTTTSQLRSSVSPVRSAPKPSNDATNFFSKVLQRQAPPKKKSHKRVLSSTFVPKDPQQFYHSTGGAYASSGVHVGGVRGVQLGTVQGVSHGGAGVIDLSGLPPGSTIEGALPAGMRVVGPGGAQIQGPPPVQYVDNSDAVMTSRVLSSSDVHSGRFAPTPQTIRRQHAMAAMRGEVVSMPVDDHGLDLSSIPLAEWEPIDTSETGNMPAEGQ